MIFSESVNSLGKYTSNSTNTYSRNSSWSSRGFLPLYSSMISCDWSVITFITRACAGFGHPPSVIVIDAHVPSGTGFSFVAKAPSTTSPSGAAFVVSVTGSGSAVSSLEVGSVASSPGIGSVASSLGVCSVFDVSSACSSACESFFDSLL